MSTETVQALLLSAAVSLVVQGSGCGLPAMDADATTGHGTATAEGSSSMPAETAGTSPTEGGEEQNSAASQANPCSAYQMLSSGNLSDQPAGLVADCASSQFPLSSAIHREIAVACAFADERPSCLVGDGACSTDGDCGTGACLPTSLAAGSCVCIDPCTTDDDCGAAEACLCRSGFAAGPQGGETFFERSMCIPADCRTDADCPTGSLCGLSMDPCSLGESLHCHTNDDECHGFEDCSGPNQGMCGWNEIEQRWTCFSFGACE